MADPKKTESAVELEIDGKKVRLQLLAHDFRGAKTATRYGDVEVKLGPEGNVKTYTVRVGAWEWYQAEQHFEVKGDAAVVDAFKASEEGALEFLKIALAEAHPDLDLKAVATLRSFRPETGPTLDDAVLCAMAFSRPERVPERADPKALAVLAAALAMRSESSTS